MVEWLANNYPTVLIIVTGGVLIFGIGKWVGAVNTDRASLKEFMTEVREKLDKIFERLPRQTVSPGSPIRLTDFGREVSRNLEVADWANEQASGLVDRARGRPEYEIQDLCEKHIEEVYERDEALQETMRAGAYAHGTQVEKIRDVYMIELRDTLFRILQISPQQ